MTGTDDLIRSLAADTRRQAAGLSSAWYVAASAALVIAAIVFAVALGPRPDLAAAIETPRFLFKFVFTLALAAAAFNAARALSRPGDDWRDAVPYLAIAPILIVGAALIELIVVPAASWPARLVGDNSLICLTWIPLIGAGPLVIFMLVLRYGAPTRPALAGAVAGLLAGGIAAAFYAAKCTDDSPLFVMTWYTIAIAGLALLGAAGAKRFARW